MSGCFRWIGPVGWVGGFVGIVFYALREAHRERYE
jgi:hypothetical protein